jgi:hypothetical protein
LRHLGCSLPIQFWYLGRAELDEEMEGLVAPLGVECVDATLVRRVHPMRRLHGWELKPYALVHSPFREVILLDADNVPLIDPEILFDTPEFRQHGAIFWPDFGHLEKAGPIWHNCGLDRSAHPDFESGQMVVDKQRCWEALALTLWFNAHSDFYYRYIYGDKDTFHLAFRKLAAPYAMIPHPIEPLVGAMCQHDFAGNRIFQHRNTAKWNFHGKNRSVPGFLHEEECMAYLFELRKKWSGRIRRYKQPVAEAL